MDGRDDQGVTGGFIPPYIEERIRHRTESLARVCPVCNAQPTEPCTIPNDNSRRTVNWFHLDREVDDENVLGHAQEERKEAP